MFKEIGAIMGLLSVPHNNVLKLDKVANINGDDLTLTIASEECAELIQAITKVKRYGFHDEYEDNLHEDVADVLGYQNGSRDINRHVDEEDRQNYQNGTFDLSSCMTKKQ